MAWPLAWVYARLLPTHPYLAATLAAVLESGVTMLLGWVAGWGTLEHFFWFAVLHAGGSGYRWHDSAGKRTLTTSGPLTLPHLIFLGWLGMLFHAGPSLVFASLPELLALSVLPSTVLSTLLAISAHVIYNLTTPSVLGMARGKRPSRSEEQVEEALRQAGNISGAARLLQVHPTTVSYLAAKYGLEHLLDEKRWAAQARAVQEAVRLQREHVEIERIPETVKMPEMARPTVAEEIQTVDTQQGLDWLTSLPKPGRGVLPRVFRVEATTDRNGQIDFYLGSVAGRSVMARLSTGRNQAGLVTIVVEAVGPDQWRVRTYRTVNDQVFHTESWLVPHRNTAFAAAGYCPELQVR